MAQTGEPPRNKGLRWIGAAFAVLTAVTLCVVGVLVRQYFVRRSLTDERVAILRPLEARLVSLCEADGRWPTREAGPVLPTTASWTTAPGFAELGAEPVAPLPQHYAVQVSPGFRRAVLRIELIGLPDTPAAGTWYARRCVRDSEGCHCRTPLMASAPTLRGGPAPSPAP
jgi:hypothetical protein